MKKFFLIPLVAFALFAGSCELESLINSSLGSVYDVEVINHCSFSVEVYISQSSSTPAAYIPLVRNNGTQRFLEVSSGTKYLHIKSSDSSAAAPTAAKKATSLSQTVSYYYTTWIISWDAVKGEYILTASN